MHYFLYFCTYSFLGWIIDTTYRSFLAQDLIFGGWFISLQIPVPIAPVYGFGALALILLLPLVKRMPAILMGVVPGLIFTLVEYISGAFTLAIFGRRAWDYSASMYHLHGHIDLLHTSFWVLLGYIFMIIIHPIVVKSLHQEYYQVTDRHVTKMYM